MQIAIYATDSIYMSVNSYFTLVYSFKTT